MGPTHSIPYDQVNRLTSVKQQYLQLQLRCGGDVTSEIGLLEPVTLTSTYDQIEPRDGVAVDEQSYNDVQLCIW